jgi:hypothetical protein
MTTNKGWQKWLDLVLTIKQIDMAGIGRITKEEKARRDKLAEQGIKVCNKCKEEKPFSEFNKDKNKAYGFDGRCRSCGKQYYQENKEQINGRSKQYCQDNKERKKEYDKQYKQENKERLREKDKQYNQRPEVKARRNNWHKERRESDPMFKAGIYMRNLLRSGFKQKGWTKDSSTQEIVGCSWEQWKLWVGGEPSKEMHIDHVIPQSLAETPEELKLLNHYTNLQLLPAEENTSKGNRYIRKHNLNRVLAHHPQPDKLKEIVERSDVEII